MVKYWIAILMILNVFFNTVLMLTCILTKLRKNLQYHQNTTISDQEFDMLQEFEIPNFLSYY